MNVFFLLLIVVAALNGCVSPSYHARKLREARGEEPIKVVSEDQEYKDFMEHKRGIEE